MNLQEKVIFGLGFENSNAEEHIVMQILLHDFNPKLAILNHKVKRGIDDWKSLYEELREEFERRFAQGDCTAPQISLKKEIEGMLLQKQASQKPSTLQLQGPESIFKQLCAKHKVPDSLVFNKKCELIFRRAAAKGDLEDLKSCVTHFKINVNATDDSDGSKRTALHWAVLKASENETHKLKLEKYKRCIAYLLECGSDRNQPDDTVDKKTPMDLVPAGSSLRIYIEELIRNNLTETP